MNNTLTGLSVVSKKFSCAVFFAQRKPIHCRFRIAGAHPRRARLLLLLVHRGVERIDIHRNAARLERVLREIERKTIGVVERERDLALEPVAGLEGAALLVENGKPALERIAEAGLF